MKIVKNIVNAVQQAMKPPPNITIDKWSDEYRKLPSISSSEPGKWRTSRFPFLREIMYELSPQSTATEVSVMKGAQLGFTELAVNFMFYTIDHNPVPMLYVQKTLDAVQKFSKQRFKPSVDLCPAIAKKIGKARSRDSENTQLIKNFPGGIIILGGANSASSLRSMPICMLTLDEWDSFEADIQEEGDPAELAIRRTANFPRKKIYYLSTPKTAETSNIEPKFEEGDMRYYYVPCPHCKHKQILTWSNMKWDKGKPQTVKYQCEECRKLIEERYKTWMLENGEWIAHNPNGDHPSFHISGLYSPLGFYSWVDAAKLFYKATKTFDKDKLKVFVNTVLAETYSETGKEIEAGHLLSRKEQYSGQVPAGVVVLTAGVDVQDSRLEYEIVGWGSGEESWSIEYGILHGDTERQMVWKLLDGKLIQRTWRHENGMQMNLACVAVDSGFRAKVVYDYCLPREPLRFFPIKGQPGWGKGYLNRPRNRQKEGVYLFNLFVDEVKSKIYSTLMIEENGPGFCHFPANVPEYDGEYFKTLTAERLVTRRVNGQKKLVWELPKGRRNEGLDCRGYAYGALNILKANLEALSAAGQVLSTNNQKVRTKTKKRRTLSKGIS